MNKDVFSLSKKEIIKYLPEFNNMSDLTLKELRMTIRDICTMDLGFSKNTTIKTKDYVKAYDRFLTKLEIERQRKIKREKAEDDDLFNLLNEMKREEKLKKTERKRYQQSIKDEALTQRERPPNSVA